MSVRQTAYLFRVRNNDSKKREKRLRNFEFRIDENKRERYRHFIKYYGIISKIIHEQENVTRVRR